MRIPIIYTLEKNISEQEISISGSDGHYLKQVLRLSVGDKVVVKTFSFKYETMIATYEKDKVLLSIKNKTKLEAHQSKNNPPKINLYLSLIKPSSLKSIISKITELGVDGFYPIETENSSLRSRDFNQARYEKIVLASLQQSRRDLPLLINPPQKLEQLLKAKPETSPEKEHKAKQKTKQNFSHPQALNLLADESTEQKFSWTENRYKEINLFVGPEGGLTLREKDLLTDIGFRKVTLGNFVLRVETAVLFLLAKVMSV